ncbi:MAG: hypothetical protein WAW37_10070, partial [Syntrophobacteraceae bacterium]
MKKSNYCPAFALLTISILFLISCERSYDNDKVQSKDGNNQTTIVVGIGTWAGFGTGIVGMEKGFFEKMKVETKILDDNAARHAAFQSGALSIMISSIDVFA